MVTLATRGIRDPVTLVINRYSGIGLGNAGLALYFGEIRPGLGRGDFIVRSLEFRNPKYYL